MATELLQLGEEDTMVAAKERGDEDRIDAARLAFRTALLLGSPVLRDPKVFRRFSSFLKHFGILLDLAARSNLRLSGFRCGGDLEFYVDVFRGRRDCGFISKGWDDPGTRVGDIIYVSGRHIPTFRGAIEAVVDACCGEGICFHPRPVPGGLEVELWTPVYGDPMPARSILQALNSLRDCERRLRRLSPMARVPPAVRRKRFNNGSTR